MLGNAVSFYTGISRYIFFFALTGPIIVIGAVGKTLPAIRPPYVPLMIFLLVALVFDFVYGPPLILFGVKMCVLLLCCSILYGRCRHPLETLASRLLLLSNIGWLIALVSTTLPDGLTFVPDYLEKLRRYYSGSGIFYWSQNFSGLFLVGDEKSPLGLITGIPKYSAYFNEPGINAFYLCLSIAILLARGVKISKLTAVLTFINLLLTFSLTGFLALFSVIGIFLVGRLKPRMKMVYLICLPCCAALLLVAASDTAYVTAKLAGSLQGSLLLLQNLKLQSWIGLSSFNARVGDFVVGGIGAISLVPWLAVVFLLLVLFLYSFVRILLNQRAGLSNFQQICLILTPILIFSIKSINHSIVNPISVVVIGFLALGISRKAHGS